MRWRVGSVVQSGVLAFLSPASSTSSVTRSARVAARGATAMEIKELAGHADLTTTMRYMHLSPSAKRKRSVAGAPVPARLSWQQFATAAQEWCRASF